MMVLPFMTTPLLYVTYNTLCLRNLLPPEGSGVHDGAVIHFPEGGTNV